MREPQRYHEAVVESTGNWLLYRRDPRLENPLQLDAPKPSLPLVDFLMMEERFRKVLNPASKKYDPKMITELQQRIDKRYALFNNEAKKTEWEEVEVLEL